MSAKLKVAVCQMNSVDSAEMNIAQVKKLVAQKSEKIDLYCFPENSLYMRIREGEKVAGLKLTDPVFAEAQELARDKKAYFHFGSLPLRMDGELRNASVLVTPDGQVQPTYFKIHLFDISLPGQPTVRESDVYKSGEEPKIIQIGSWHVGQTICYDLRFSELFNYYATHSVEMILVPSSFLVPTGKVHWEVLLRARAIESQSYIVAAAQAGLHKGVHSGTRETYGHSLVVDPWGQIIAQAESLGPEILVVDLDIARVEQVRSQIPMRHHRKLVKMKR